MAHGQVQRNYLNSGFEEPPLTATPVATGCYVQVDEGTVPGWTTTHPSQAGSGSCASPPVSTGRLIELWRTNFQGVIARSGANFAELNAEASSRLYQNVCLVNGDVINWRFSHRGRGSATVRDVMDYNIGASQPIVRVGTTNNGAFNTPIVSQGTANAPVAGGNGWVDYSGSYTYTGATGVTSLGFESISTGGGGNTVGNFLDNIQIELKPFVEFVQAASSTPESSSSNRPTLRIAGTVFTPFTVTVQISGGTATLGTDYTTPGNSTTLTVNIPTGQYDGVSAGSLFALPLTITQDALVESNETIQFSIVPPTGAAPPYSFNSNAVCGGAPQTTWNYTIVDDDSSLAITKNAAAPVAVAGQPTQFDVAYTITVNNPTLTANSYQLSDTPGLDPDVTIISASYRLNGGAAVALAGAGPWVMPPAFRALPAGATDSYVVTVRVTINRGGSVANDSCTNPGSTGNGLYNAVIATQQAAGSPTFTANGCTNTPTPVWVTLRKSLPSRAVPTDQIAVRVRSAGTVVATATTSGTAEPASATTGVIVIPPGNTLQLEEAVKANGTGADASLTNYRPLITCTNALAGSSTTLPTGAGSPGPNRQEWPAFATNSGDDIDCLITNNRLTANLSLTKTNTPGLNGEVDQGNDTVAAGTNTTYTIRVTNNGPDPVTGAIVRDTPGAGLTCSTVTITGPGAPTGPFTMAQLAAGITLGTLNANETAIVSVTCAVA